MTGAAGSKSADLLARLDFCMTQRIPLQRAGAMMRLRFVEIALSAVFLLSCVVAPAHASLVDSGSGVLDTVQSLEWLKVGATLGQSPAAALSNNPGYQLATLSQVETLFEDAGIPAAHLNNSQYYVSDLPAGNLLASLLGYSLSPWVQYFGPGAASWEYETWGNLLDGSGTGWDQEFIDVRSQVLGSPGVATSFAAFDNCFGCSVSLNFNFLVRSAAPVPEPTPLAILGAALAGLVLLRRRKRA